MISPFDTVWWNFKWELSSQWCGVWVIEVALAKEGVVWGRWRHVLGGRRELGAWCFEGKLDVHCESNNRTHACPFSSCNYYCCWCCWYSPPGLPCASSSPIWKFTISQNNLCQAVLISYQREGDNFLTFFPVLLMDEDGYSCSWALPPPKLVVEVACSFIWKHNLDFRKAWNLCIHLQTWQQPDQQDEPGQDWSVDGF